MRVTVTRRGGIAGIGLRGSADTTHFAGSEQALLAHRGATSKTPSHPDAFHYEVAYDEGVITLGESDVTGPLRELVDAALKAGDIVPP
jgi:hypothetical protein